jgi:hypothetical protein
MCLRIAAPSARCSRALATNGPCWSSSRSATGQSASTSCGAVQMVATHFVATRALRRLKGSDTIPQQDSNGNLAVKLLRTFAAQTEALQRYRGRGQQKVTVEHVHVHTGGQAIVGSVSQTGGGRDSDENRGQPHPHAPENGGAITAFSRLAAPSCRRKTRHHHRASAPPSSPRAFASE